MSLLSRIASVFNGSSSSAVAAAEPSGFGGRMRRLVAFDLGKSGRRLAAIPSTQQAVNNLIRQYGAQVIARSRYLTRNNPYAIAAKETFVSALIGTGIKPSTLGETAEVKKAVQELFLDWTAVADASGVVDFFGQQETIGSELYDTGECFAVFEEQTTDPDLPNVSIRLYQAEMLPYQLTLPPKSMAAGNRIEMGIEFSPDNKRVAYHFYKVLPGESAWRNDASPLETVRIPAERVLHIYRPFCAGQIRGVPHTLGGLVALAMLDLYDDAELERKRVAALFTAFITKPDDADGDSALGAVLNADTNVMEIPSSAVNGDIYGLEPGAMVPLEQGEDVKFAEPADVGGQYEDFQYRQLLRAAAGLGVPYANMTGDLKAVNYSSIRAGLVEFRRRIEKMQWNVIIFQYCRPVWNAFLDAATLQGLAPWTAAEYRRNKRLHRRVRWLPPRWEWVDPLKDQQAEELAVRNGFKARADVIESQGFDPEETDERIASDKEREESLGLKFGTPSPVAPGAPGAAPGRRAAQHKPGG